MRHRLALSAIVCACLAASGPAFAADLAYADVEPAPASGWKFSFTPYAWAININGDFTAAGNTASVNEDFFQIVDKSNSFAAWMSYFEARNDKFAFFADLIWYDLGFPGRFKLSGSPLARLPQAVVSVAGRAQLDYEATIVQSGVAYEVARWENAPGSFTAIDVLGSARYWNLDTSLSLNVTGTLDIDFSRLGLNVNRSRGVAVSASNTLEWVDPVVGARIRHQIAPGKALRLLGDIGGFGVGSDFSWQAVALYGWHTTCLGIPFNADIGYRALYVDYSESGRFGKNGIDAVQHGPVMGVSFNW